MLTVSNAFRAALDKQIRRPGHCEIIFNYKSGGSYSVASSTIKSVEIHETGDPLSRELPTEECTIVLADYNRLWDPANSSGYYSSTEQGMSFLVRFGIEVGNSTEWADYELFISDCSLEWNDYEARFHGIKTLGTWNNVFDSFAEESNLYTLGEAIAIAQFPPNTPQQAILQSIDFDYNKLSAVPVIAHSNLDEYATKDALLAVAFAGGCAVRTDNNGNVAIKDYFETDINKNYVVLTRNDILSITSASRLPQIKNEIVTYYANPEDAGSESEVLNVSINFDIDGFFGGDVPYFVRFSQPIVPTSKRFTATTNLIAYSFAYVVTRTGIFITNMERVDSSQPVTLKMNGIPLNTQESKIAYQIEQTGSENEEIDNQLMTISNAQSVAEYRGDYLDRTRTLYSFDYRGDPSIQPYDIVRIELPVGQSFEMCHCIVVERTFKMENGFSGSLVVRKIDNPSINQIINTAISDYAVSDYAVSDEQ